MRTDFGPLWSAKERFQTLPRHARTPGRRFPSDNLDHSELLLGAVGPSTQTSGALCLTSTVTRPPLCGFTAATGRTWRWTSGRSLVSIRRWKTSGSPDERLRRVLHDYLAWATTTMMSRYHHSADDVPGGLRIPKWSWDGRVG